MKSIFKLLNKSGAISKPVLVGMISGSSVLLTAGLMFYTSNAPQPDNSGYLSAGAGSLSQQASRLGADAYADNIYTRQTLEDMETFSSNSAARPQTGQPSGSADNNTDNNIRSRAEIEAALTGHVESVRAQGQVPPAQGAADFISANQGTIEGLTGGGVKADTGGPAPSSGPGATAEAKLRASTTRTGGAATSSVPGASTSSSVQTSSTTGGRGTSAAPSNSDATVSSMMENARVTQQNQDRLYAAGPRGNSTDTPVSSDNNTGSARSSGGSNPQRSQQTVDDLERVSTQTNKAEKTSLSDAQAGMVSAARAFQSEGDSNGVGGVSENAKANQDPVKRIQDLFNSMGDQSETNKALNKIDETQEKIKDLKGKVKNLFPIMLTVGLAAIAVTAFLAQKAAKSPPQTFWAWYGPAIAAAAVGFGAMMGLFIPIMKNINEMEGLRKGAAGAWTWMAPVVYTVLNIGLAIALVPWGKGKQPELEVLPDDFIGPPNVKAPVPKPPLSKGAQFFKNVGIQTGMTVGKDVLGDLKNYEPDEVPDPDDPKNGGN